MRQSRPINLRDRYLRDCKRCDQIYRTNSKHSKVCPACSREYKKGGDKVEYRKRIQAKIKRLQQLHAQSRAEEQGMED